MAKLDFPDASFSPWVAPNNVIYTYIGTSPNGYWEANTANAATNLTAVFVERTGSTMTGALKLDNAGSVSLPDISFDGDINTGLFQPGADSLAITTGGTQRVTVDSAGNVGIGTSSPRRHFHVHNPATATTGLMLTNANTGEANDSQGFQLKVAADSHVEISQMENSHLGIFTNATERMRIDSSGNVGVNTTSPSCLLNIQSSSTGEIARFGTSVSTGEVNISVGYSHTNQFKLGYDTATGDGILQTISNASLLFKPAGTERMRIDSSGNVGIGTLSPNNYTNYSTLTLNGTSGGAIDFETSGTKVGTVYSSGSLLYIQAAASKSLVLSSNDTERMRIDSSGRVGIATTPYAWEASSNSQALQVRQGVLWDYTSTQFDVGRNYYYDGSAYKYGSSSTAERIAFHQGNHIFSNAVSGTANATLTWSERMRIDSSGIVLIGDTVGGGANLNVYGTSSATIYQNANTGTGNTGNGMFVGNWGSVDAYLYNYENASIIFGTNSTEQMRIYADGGVSLKKYLEFRNGGDTAWAGYLGSANHIISGSASTDFGLRAEANLLFASGGNTERMRIRDNGDVIIGPYRAPATYGTVAQNIPYSIKVAPYGWQNGSELASISMGSHGGTGQDDGQIVFKTGSNVHSTPNALQERARILSTGGITFNGDTSYLNALDDYEEGSFSPIIAGSTAAGSTTYSYQVGTYTKIGRLVHIRAYVGWSAQTGSGLLYLRGLPFTVSSDTSYGGPAINYWHSLTQAGAGVSALWGPGNDYVYFYNLGNPTASSINVEYTGSIIVGGSYYI